MIVDVHPLLTCVWIHKHSFTLTTFSYLFFLYSKLYDTRNQNIVVGCCVFRHRIMCGDCTVVCARYRDDRGTQRNVDKRIVCRWRVGRCRTDFCAVVTKDWLTVKDSDHTKCLFKGILFGSCRVIWRISLCLYETKAYKNCVYFGSCV